ncbi:MAG: hypothetical protein KDA87_03835 [Planctomycetales bacterium]|nr:hypothetical protein [Planctomycetales bacterium]
MEIELRLDLRDSELSFTAAHQLKNAIIDRIELEGVGEVTGSGQGFGEIDMDIELADDDETLSRLRKIIHDFQLNDQATILRHGK